MNRLFNLLVSSLFALLVLFPFFVGVDVISPSTPAKEETRPCEAFYGEQQTDAECFHWTKIALGHAQEDRENDRIWDVEVEEKLIRVGRSLGRSSIANPSMVFVAPVDANWGTTVSFTVGFAHKVALVGIYKFGGFQVYSDGPFCIWKGCSVDFRGTHSLFLSWEDLPKEGTVGIIVRGGEGNLKDQKLSFHGIRVYNP